MKKYPILIVIPHGGYKVPEEFAEHAIAGDLELLLSADTCANELFCADEFCAAVLNTHISRLFIDVDRAPLDLPPRKFDGVIKKETIFGKDIFPPDTFPDDLALAALLRRYYFPFHDTMRKIATSGEVSLIIECHTVHAVGPRNSIDRNRPRPIVSIQNKTEKDGSIIETAPESLARELAASFKKSFSSEESATENPFVVYESPAQGELMRRHSGAAPYLRLNLSRGLFLNDAHFNYDYGKIDQIRIGELRTKTHQALSRFAGKVF
jgi:formiminoglutamase